ncbi:hypothetical protein [Streptomyces sp. NPDC008001]|uniref:hypothetical protein n=1 Tax=Streptomyces sp. NPDC008001 TaxID=3364804 RepID=UPI0036E2590A
MTLWSPAPPPPQSAMRTAIAVLVSVLLLFSGGTGTVFALGTGPEESPVSVEFATADDCVADTRPPRIQAFPARRTCVPSPQDSAGSGSPPIPPRRLSPPAAEGPAAAAGHAHNDVLRC